MMVTYEDIKKANDAIQTTDIKGKDYAEVNQRIKAFRMVYPTGSIKTQMLSNENGVCIFQAEVGFYDDDENAPGYVKLGTGTAYEKENSSFINKTSYIENCETSAVGRALGMAGFGIDTSEASADEVQNAIVNQNKPVSDAPKCSQCGAIIKASGKHTADDIAQGSFNKYGRVLCVECGKAEKAKAAAK